MSPYLSFLHRAHFGSLKNHQEFKFSCCQHLHTEVEDFTRRDVFQIFSLAYRPHTNLPNGVQTIIVAPSCDLKVLFVKHFWALNPSLIYNKCITYIYTDTIITWSCRDQLQHPCPPIHTQWKILHISLTFKKDKTEGILINRMIIEVIMHNAYLHDRK